MQRLLNYFQDGISSKTLATVGAEIETQFVDTNGQAVSTATSQQMLKHLARNGWEIAGRKNDLITTLVDKDDNKIFYELGRHNMEVATTPLKPSDVLATTRQCLAQLYESARQSGAAPFLAPILFGEEDLLVVPDERDMVWLELDGREALAPLARTSSVQFTVSVSPQDAMKILNNFGEKIDSFLSDYPQDKVWKQYIARSSAKYIPTRYGGPLSFASLEDYCQALIQHDVVQGARLVPFYSTINLDLSLYLRSIWWHFRLKRYNDALCIEVRPMARRSDEEFPKQLDKVLTVVNA